MSINAAKEAGIARPRRHRLWRTAKNLLLILLALLLTAIGASILMTTVDINTIERLQGGLDDLAFPLFLLRVSLYAMVLAFWEPLTKWTGRRQQWRDDELARALGKRNQMALWLVCFELLVSGSLLWRIWA